MCGIFAYLNYEVTQPRDRIVEILLTGLRRLEYRGYDSAGISIDEKPVTEDKAEVAMPLVFRQQGKIDSLSDKVIEGEKRRLLCEVSSS